MTISSREAPPSGKTRFALWPLPDLRLNADGAIALNDASDGEAGPSDYDRGYADGAMGAQRQVDARIGDALRALTAALHKLEETQRQHEGHNERTIHALAVAVAEQIIQREIATNEAVVRDLVQKAIQDVREDGPIAVRVNPDDLDVMVRDPEWESTDSPALQWIADPNITRGGCIVESEERLVDGRIEAALKELFQRLNDV